MVEDIINVKDLGDNALFAHVTSMHNLQSSRVAVIAAANVARMLRVLRLLQEMDAFARVRLSRCLEPRQKYSKKL